MMLLDTSPEPNSGTAHSVDAMTMTALMLFSALIFTSVWEECLHSMWSRWQRGISMVVWHPQVALHINQTSPKDRNCQNMDHK